MVLKPADESAESGVFLNCRACDVGATLWMDRSDVALYRCDSCGFVSGKPAHEMAPEERYEDYYRRPAPPAPEARYHEWIARAESAMGRGRLLEVGAGGGGFVRAALVRGWRVDATEVSKTGLDALRETGAAVFAGDVRAAKYPDGTFDLVVSLELLEHLSAPMMHLRELWRITRPGGLLLLTTPNFNGLSRRCLGTRWRVIDPEHLCYFTPASLSRMLRGVGYEWVCVKSRSLDLLSWRRGTGSAGVSPFDPYASARLRDTVQGSKLLRAGKATVNKILQITGLGDSLLTWAGR